MITKIFKRAAVQLILTLGIVSSASAGNINPYYLFDGDSSKAWEITNGVVVNTFNTFSLGYPPAIRDSIWLGQLNDSFAQEYTLAGVATGSASTGSSAFSQLLDGATGSNGKNYGVECCGTQNSVTVANNDWSNQTILFNLSFNGGGISYDPTDATLYVAHLRENIIDHFDLTGRLINSIDFGQFLVGLSYDGLSDSMWGWNRDSQHLVQFNRTGTVLQDFIVAGIQGNPFGGEMALTEGAQVPEPSTTALLGLGLLGFAASRRKSVKSRNA